MCNQHTGQDNTTHRDKTETNEEMPWGDDGAGQTGAAPGRPRSTPSPTPTEKSVAGGGLKE